MKQRERESRRERERERESKIEQKRERERASRLHACMHACMHASIHACLYTYIPPCSVFVGVSLRNAVASTVTHALLGSGGLWLWVQALRSNSVM